MSSGLFVISCPTCGREIHLDAAGNGFCAGCQVRYLHRFGELIPLPRPRVDEPGDVTRAAT